MKTYVLASSWEVAAECAMRIFAGQIPNLYPTLVDARIEQSRRAGSSLALRYRLFCVEEKDQEISVEPVDAA